MQLSVKHFDWENPTSGGAIHINTKDEIEVYQFTPEFMHLNSRIDKNGIYIQLKDTCIIVKAEELIHYVGRLTYGNSPSVILTFEYDLTKSKSLGSILDIVSPKSFYIFYLKKGR